MQTGPCGDATVLDSGDAMVLHGRWKSHEGSENDKKEEKSSKSEKKPQKIWRNEKMALPLHRI